MLPLALILAGILGILTRTAEGQTIDAPASLQSAGGFSPHILRWTHPDDPDLLEFEWQAVGAEVWIPIESPIERDGVWYAMVWTGGYTGEIHMRAISYAGTTAVVSDPSLAAPAPPSCTAADIDRNGYVGMSDWGELKKHWGKACAVPAEATE